MDKLVEKVTTARSKWEKQSTTIQLQNKQLLLDFGLNPLDIWPGTIEILWHFTRSCIDFSSSHIVSFGRLLAAVFLSEAAVCRIIVGMTHINVDVWCLDIEHKPDCWNLVVSMSQASLEKPMWKRTNTLGYALLYVLRWHFTLTMWMCFMVVNYMIFGRGLQLKWLYKLADFFLRITFSFL